MADIRTEPRAASSESAGPRKIAMGIGAQSPIWRRALFRAFASRYIRRKCPTEDGLFEAYVTPSSSLRVLDLRQSLVDPVHQRFIRDWVTRDAVVWDVGSNVGLFALPAALKARDGWVYAFEADIDLAGTLLRSLRLRQNQGLEVAVLCVAVSNADGTAVFQISKFSRAMNKLEAAGKWHDSQVATEELRSVPTMRIDTLASTLAPPTIIKVDVEGAEMEVLEGGETTIAKHRPTMLVEGPSEIKQSMRAFFEKHDYALLDAETQRLLQDPVWDTIAVPKEKLVAGKPA